MKRFHVHLAVDDLAASIRFCPTAFGMPPTVVKNDYAKWMLDDQSGAACCYAESNKYWTVDPQGIAWETFHSLGSIPVYGEPREAAADGAA